MYFKVLKSSTHTKQYIDGHISQMNPKQFENHINNGKPIIVMFASNHCQYCKQMIPKMQQVAKHIKHCLTTIITSQEIMKKYNITGVPTILYIKNHHNVIEYNGDRSVKSLINFIRSNQ
jgi:thiol-disulfide isomerase/thioredoxin